MEIKVEVQESVPCVLVSGEIDHFVAPKLQRQLDELIDAGRNDIIIDLSEVNYLDSGGIGVFFNAMQQLVPRDGRIGVVCDDPNVVRILELVGLFDERTNVSLYSDQDKAKGAFDKGMAI